MEIKHKGKPLNKRKLLQQMFIALCAGIVFGVTACVVFVLFEPQIGKLIGLTKEDNVTIQVGGQDTEDLNLGVGSLQIMDRQQEIYKLYETGMNAAKSMVGIMPGGNVEYEGNGSNDIMGSAILLTQTSESLLFLTTPNAVKGIANVQVIFANGEAALGKVVATDSETKLSVVSVEVDEVSKKSLEEIKLANLGKSSVAKRGESVVVIGNPLGESRTMVCGRIVSTIGKVNYLDREYSMLETDIVGKTYSNGFLISEEGNILGVLTHDKDEKNEVCTIRAVGMSEISELIERLCNASELPYVGVSISTVTKTVAERYAIKEGVFVENLALNSPAVQAGIQKGDIITGFGKKEITTAKQFYKGLMKLEPGESVQIRLLRYSNGAYKNVVCNVVLGSH